MEMDHTEIIKYAIDNFFRERKEIFDIRSYHMINVEMHRDCDYVFCDVLIGRKSYIYIFKLSCMHILAYNSFPYRLP